MIILFSLFGGLNTFGQDRIDILTLGGNFSSPAESKAHGNEVQYRSYFANVKLPVVIDSVNIWYNALSYTHHHLEHKNDLPKTIANPLRIQHVIYQLGYIRKISKDRKLYLFAIPRLMSDFQEINSNHFQIGGLFALEKKYGGNLTMRYGFVYNQDYFGKFVNPSIYIDWRVSKKIRINAFLPLDSKIQYQINEGLDLGVFHYSPVLSYRLSHESYQNDYIQLNQIDLGIYSRKKLGGNFFLEGRLFYPLSRSFDQYKEDDQLDFKLNVLSFGEDRSIINESFSKTLSFNLRFIYSIPIPE